MPFTRIPSQILKGSASVSAMALPSEKTVWAENPELYGNFEPRPPARG
jgi:hypothetical protein